MSDLEILEERVLLSLPRGDEELRLTAVRARAGRGEASCDDEVF